MRPLSTIYLLSLLMFAACAAPVVHDARYYREQGGDRIVNVDGYAVHVQQQTFGDYVAWGGETGRDGKQIKYRQRRAIEIISKCRVKEVLSKPKDSVLYATVNC